MPTVTIYTRPVDDEVWDWARWKAAQDRISIARVVADALRAYRRDHDEQTARDGEDRGDQ